MARFLYSAAMSLDGFIAGPGGDMSWLTDYFGPNPMVDELIPQVGALLVGGRTYGGDDPHRGREGEGKAFGGGWEGPQFVLTRRPQATPEPGVTFLADLNDAVDAAGRAAGEGYVNILGANVAAQCLALGVLDEVLVSIVPMMLGDGTRLFERPGGAGVRLEQISRSHTATLTSLWFRVIRP
jgi:dihydrofolate reductase